jgi:hypothetical protein
MAKKRRFGRVRKLPSGRYQARYPGPDGIDRPAPETFATKTSATAWLTMKEAEIRSGDWLDPDAGKMKFGDYADTWLRDHVIRPRTQELYRSQIKNHLKPTFGNVDLGDIKEGDIRRWRKERLTTGPTQKRPFGPVTVAKVYRLLHAILAMRRRRAAARRRARARARRARARSDRARNGHAALSRYPKRVRKMPLNCESGRRESNPHDQLGRIRPYIA